MKSTINVQKLDGRYTGYPYFSHLLDLNHMPLILRRAEFYRLFKWFWEALGPGCDRDIVLNSVYYYDISSLDQRIQNNTADLIDELSDMEWAWNIDDRKLRFYLKDQAYTLYQLKYNNSI